MNTINSINIFLEIPGYVNENQIRGAGCHGGQQEARLPFPNAECYHSLQFPADNLIVLGAKTTCKDRWRQVLTEADRVNVKFLFTLQQGISKNQLKEMHDSHLTLVVPQKYISSFPLEYQSEISDLRGFIRMVQKKQESLPKYYKLV